jgi:phage/plasmid-like protein (TIGR03299 family)
MGHELETLNGKAKMFFVGETPWHKLGTKLSVAPTSAEAIKAAGLDWLVETMALETSQGGVTVPNHKAVVRTSDCKVLGVVGKGYVPLQNKDAFGFFDAFIEAGEATYETAGSLRGGARIWILAKLNRDPSVIMGDDVVEKYVLLSNGHDGSLAVRAGFTPIRTVCSNTLAVAHGDSASKLLRIRHTSKVTEALEAVREVMDMANATFEASAEQYRLLAHKNINKSDLRKYVTKVFATKAAMAESDADGSDPKAPEKVYEAVERLFESGRGSDMESAKGTAWGAYNAVNEFLGYERGNNEENRLNNMWYGTSAKLNEKALQYAYVMAS